MSSVSPPSSPSTLSPSIPLSPSIQSSPSIPDTPSIPSSPSVSPSPLADPDLYDDVDLEAVYRGYVPDSSSDVVDHRSSIFDSEAEPQVDWDPESASESQSHHSEADSESLMSVEIDHHDPLFNDSDPFSPDLADELELALLAEMDQLPRLREQRPPGDGEGGMPGQGLGGDARRNGSGDVLVDLELYFEQGRNERRSQNNQNGPADVIDLTNEPDSPIQRHAPRPLANPRRQNSQGRNPPSFTRSDSSILAGNAPVIDLTDDSPEIPRRRTHVPPPPPPPRHRERSRQPVGFMYSGGNAFSGLAAGIRRHLYPFRLFPGPDDEVQLLGMLHNRINQGGDLNNPLGNIQLQYEHGAFDQRAESPKPVHQAPPPPRPGFTRDTASDLVVICPACNEELAYDPNVPVNEKQPARKSNKRQRSEHHFWALKGCGHVYCEDCFENRRPAAKRPNTGFRRDDDSKLVCAVDGCETQATNKTAWVGIYL
ncbi:hypothetical protein CORC01_08129 [Colletotrichum orchidophilum]|uniref:Cell cycle control protein n=1 Tax=Colletotrichum orchidophilum TaxID=1209926 RepID=A0A1G4B544_9PEZI|nr:uncharacterized protein CORC01_08129 [Colletotrichum orchidophilum]OHE96531.1 hypothetical protein CORC01_08129 [Colletotrichum orchidophilum]